MSFTVETGAGVAGANAYVTLDYCIGYCDDRGLSFAASPSTPGEEAIVRATAALDATYRGRFPGYKTNGRSQTLEWPRTAAYDREGLPIDGDEIPDEIKQAVCELAVREFAEAGATMPDVEVGGPAKRIKAGSVEIEKFGNYGASPVYQLVDGILAGLLGSPTNPSLFGVPDRRG